METWIQPARSSGTFCRLKIEPPIVLGGVPRKGQKGGPAALSHCFPWPLRIYTLNAKRVAQAGRAAVEVH